MKKLVCLTCVVLAVLITVSFAHGTQPVNINTATAEQLQTVPGIGPTMAQAIIDGRPYATLEDLLKVKGLGEKKLAGFRDMLETQETE